MRRSLLRRRCFIALATCVIATFIGGRYIVARQSSFRDEIALALQKKQQEMDYRDQLRELKLIQEQDAEVIAETARWAASIETGTQLLAHQVLHSPKISSAGDGVGVEDRHWAFRRLRRGQVPVSGDPNARNGIDHFVAERLGRNSLRLESPATNSILLRRLHFSITGLPPGIDDVLAAQHGDDIELDEIALELLNDEKFGEHWAQYWLDLVRYADSNGYEEDEIRFDAYPFRDFVIWAFNHDLPFNQFVQWQLAGDEIGNGNPMAVAATGFLTSAPYNTFMPQESERFDELDDIISTIGVSMLATTIGCARCHDHPYDDISIEDYYSLAAVFEPSRRTHSYLVADGGKAFLEIAGQVDIWREEIRQMLLASAIDENIEELDFTDAEKDVLRLPLDPDNQEQRRLLSLCNRCLLVDDSYIDEDSEPLPKDRDRYDYLQDEIAKVAPTLPERPIQGLAIEGSEVGQVPVLFGGSIDVRGDLVGPDFIHGLCVDDTSSREWSSWDPNSEAARPRAAMAHWMTDVDQGAGALVARVIVNRIWQHYFGQGLVTTPSNFGLQGETPSHPELLEWLACELIDNGWRLKHIHKLILCSNTFRQQLAPTLKHRDLVHGRWPQRLTAEMFRDSLLKLGGNLNQRLYGPPFQPAIPHEAILYRDEDDPDETWPANVLERDEVWRRSVYILKRRTNPVPILQLFDAPGGLITCPQRRNTSVPNQALALWNDPFVRGQSQRISHRILMDSGQDPRLAIENLYLALFSRVPDPREVSRLTHFLYQSPNTFGDLVQTLLMSNEFWYLD